MRRGVALHVLGGVVPDERVVAVGHPGPGPGEGVGRTAVFAHPSATSAAAAAPAALAAVLVAIARTFGRAGGRGHRPGFPRFAVTASAPPAAASAARAFALLGAFVVAMRPVGAGARLVVVGVLALDRDFVLFFLVFVLEGLVVIAVVDHRLVGRGRRRHGGVVRPLFHRGALDQALGVRHVVVQHHGDEEAHGLLQARQVRALLVQDVEPDGARRLQRRLAAALQRFQLERSQRCERAGFYGADAARALAVFADVGGAFQHARPTALAADLHQAEGRDLAHLHAGAVVLQAVLQLLLDGAVVLRLIHVDEVDDDQAGEVAQAQLPGGFLRRLHVGLQRRGFDVPLAGRAAGVHVDGDQRLGLVDHQIPTATQRNHRRIDLAEMVFDAVLDEQRRGLAVELHLLGLARHQHAHELARFLEAGLAFDEHAVDVLVVEIADRPLHEVLFLVDQGRRDRVQGRLADVLPQTQKVVVVTLELGLGALGAGRAHDQAHALRHVQALHDAFQAAAVRGGLDLARDAAAPSRIGHQHPVAAGQRQVGGQGRALVAALFLDDLH